MNNQPKPFLPLLPDEAYFNIKNAGTVQAGTPQFDDDSWYGIYINGPKSVTLENDVDNYIGYYAIIAGICLLPSEYASATDRLTLVFERIDTKQEYKNSVDALSQPNGLSISPAFHEPSQAPYINEELINNASKKSSVSRFPNPNFSLLDFPKGLFQYKVFMKLDGLRSNELTMTINKK